MNEAITSGETLTVKGKVRKVKESEYSTKIYLEGCMVFMQDKTISLDYDKMKEEYGEDKSVFLGSTKNGFIISLTNKNDEFFENTSEIIAGDELCVKGTATLVEQAMNPGQFDSRQYYQGNGYRFYMKKPQIISYEPTKNIILRRAATLRKKLRNIYETVCDENDGGVYCAMVLGDKSNMDETLSDLFTTGGIGHILAISGLHISIIGMGLYRLLRRFSVSYPVSAVISGIIIVFYGIMTGNPVSAVRAIIMFGCGVYADVIGRAYDMMSAMSLAAFFVMLRNPYIVEDCGFLLSFLAVFGIVVVGKGFIKTGNRVVDSFCGGVGIQLATMPVMCWFYYELPVYSGFLNLVVLPLVVFVMLSACLTGVVGLFSLKAAGICVGTGHYLLLLFGKLCELTLELKGSVYIAGRPRWWQIIVYAVCVLIFAFRKKTAEKVTKVLKNTSLKTDMVYFVLMRLFGLVLCMGIILLLRRDYGGFEVTSLYVGQGDGIFIQFENGRTAFIDGGTSTENELYSRTIEPFLKYKGVNRIDYLFLSHDDADHYSAWSERLETGRKKYGSGYTIEIENVFVSEAVYDFCERGRDDETIRDVLWETLYQMSRNGANISCFKAGQQFFEGDCRIVSLNGSISGNDNDDSMVLFMENDDRTYLFTGDLGNEREIEIARMCYTLLNGRKLYLLKVGHHGSKNSTSDYLLSVLEPENAIISVGKKSPYGHPHKETIERLEKYKVKIYLTLNGAVMVSGQGIEEYVQ